MTQALKIQRDIVSLEAFTITNPTQLVSNVFPTMAKNFSNFIGKLKPTNPGINLNVDKKDFIKRVEKTNYLDIAGFSIQAPDGFIAGNSFKDYSYDLMVASEKLSKIEDTLLKPFSMYLAKLISTPEHKFDTSNYFILLNNYGEERENVFNKITSYFSTGRQASKLEDIIERNSDWTNVIDQLEVANKNLGSVNRDRLNKKVEEIVSYVNIISDKVKNNELENVSKEVVKSLSEGLYQIANELQYFTAIYYHLLAANTTVENISKNIYK